MLNLNEKVDYLEETERNDNFETEKQNQVEFYNPNYTVNYFGAGREYEDWI
ncbi:hypothetical protein [Clostridium sp.]|uniref:hypothetical protein n=1 Tax=Clostridium sp. TaxID=1506 RepID=UPI001A49F7C3|nr:hypothetical protein [Clostridium sp.]MBK5234687.1 hypothetical protein [Clostridium sp.]